MMKPTNEEKKEYGKIRMRPSSARIDLDTLWKSIAKDNVNRVSHLLNLVDRMSFELEWLRGEVIDLNRKLATAEAALKVPK